MLNITSRPHSGRYRLCRPSSVGEASQATKRSCSWSTQLSISHQEGLKIPQKGCLLLLPNLMSCDTSRSSVLHPQQTRVKCEKERSCALQRQLCRILLSKKRRAKGQEKQKSKS
ncbi:hypothetical protein V8C42DRAFT_310144 [Trichoderma barbatum]